MVSLISLFSELRLDVVASGKSLPWDKARWPKSYDQEELGPTLGAPAGATQDDAGLGGLSGWAEGRGGSDTPFRKQN